MTCGRSPSNLLNPSNIDSVMKIPSLLAALALGGQLLLSSCAAPPGPNQAAGTAIGGTTGAVAGAIIGANNHRPFLGAAIGGLAGAVVGGAIGHNADEYYGTTPPPYRYGPPPPPPY
jgi:phage tail tape-measure protein